MHNATDHKRSSNIPVLICLGLNIALSVTMLVKGAPTPQGMAMMAGILVTAVTACIILAVTMGKPAVKTEIAPTPEKPTQAAIPATSQLQQPALMLLTLLQEKGRFVDFLMEDIDRYPDTKVCAAARVVHQGCKEVVRTAFDPVPVTDQPEKSAITLEAGYSSDEFTITGSIGQQPPVTGTLLHRGWRAQKIKLPTITRDSPRAESTVIIPAQVKV